MLDFERGESSPLQDFRRAVGHLAECVEFPARRVGRTALTVRRYKSPGGCPPPLAARCPTPISSQWALLRSTRPQHIPIHYLGPLLPHTGESRRRSYTSQS